MLKVEMLPLDKYRLSWYTEAMKPYNIQSENEQYLFSLYAQPHRYYHTREHIFNMLSGLSDFVYCSYLTQKEVDLLTIAICYHDAIYDPQASDNELNSVALMMLHYNNILPLEDIKTVTHLIMATKDHISYDLLSSIIIDLDLCVFGSSEKKYKKYAKSIRKEYGHVSQEDYVKGRTDVLNSFLNKENIYSNDFFGNLYEKKARTNIKSEIYLLER